MLDLGLPRQGDIVRFESDLQVSFRYGMVGIKKHELAEVLKIELEDGNSSLYQEVDYILYLALKIKEGNRIFFKLNYTINQDKIKVLPNTSTTRVLFGSN